jgi:hypothetical protein
VDANLILPKIIFLSIIGVSIISIFVLGLALLSLVILFRENRKEYFWHVIGWLFVFYLLQALKFIGEHYYGTEF